MTKIDELITALGYKTIMNNHKQITCAPGTHKTPKGDCYELEFQKLFTAKQENKT